MLEAELHMAGEVCGRDMWGQHGRGRVARWQGSETRVMEDWLLCLHWDWVKGRKDAGRADKGCADCYLASLI